MSKRSYAISLATIVMSIFFSPEITELLKVYLITVVATVTGILFVLFKWATIEQMIVNRLIARATVEMWKSAFQHELSKLITKILDEEKNEQKHKK